MKFSLLIDTDLLKTGTSANPKPEVKLRLSVRHLENLPKMVQFGWNSTVCCKMTSQIQWYGRNWNRKYSSNMADVFFQTGNSYISAVDWAITLYDVKCTKVPPIYQNSLGMMTTVLNNDPILSVPNATGVPNVPTVRYIPKMTKSDPSVPINQLVYQLIYCTNRCTKRQVYQSALGNYQERS